MVRYQEGINNLPREESLSVKEIYGLFLKKIKPTNSVLYERSITNKEHEQPARWEHPQEKLARKVSNLQWKEPQKTLEGDVFEISLNIILLNFVAWKDNIVHKEEVRLIKLAYTLLKRSFPQAHKYHEMAMNKHLCQFLAFLLCDFDLKYVTKILYHLNKKPLAIRKEEMKLQMEIVSKIDGYKDSREKDIIDYALACFYDKTMSVEEFINKLVTGTDFQALKRSALKFPELQPFLT